MFKAVDIASYIIQKYNAIGIPIIHLKLQKLLYYAQGYNLKYNNAPLFEDAVEAWNLGPVVPDVYRQFSYYGSLDILNRFGDEEFEKFSDLLPIHEKDVLDFVIDGSMKYSAHDLVNKSLRESPWLNTDKSYRDAIKIQYIREFFQNNDPLNLTGEK